MNRGRELVADQCIEVIISDLIKIAKMVEDGELSSTGVKKLIGKMFEVSPAWAYYREVSA